MESPYKDSWPPDVCVWVVKCEKWAYLILYFKI